MKHYCLLIVALLMGISLMGSTVLNYEIDAPTLSIVNDYTHLELRGLQVTGQPGAPALPWLGVKALLPLGNSAIAVKVNLSGAKTITLDKPIEAIQQQYPFSLTQQMPPNLPDPAIYSGGSAYPTETNNGLRTEYMSGHPIAFTAICPFEYYPQSSRLVVYSHAEVVIETASDSKANEALALLKQDEAITRRLLTTVDNPIDVPRYLERTAGYEYIIICDAAKTAQWQPLADLYLNKGYAVLIKTVQEITGSVQGADTQAKIRNYLINMYPTNSIKYVLLAGDTDVIPHRGFYVNMSQAGQVDDDIPADMYYNCLDGSWNNDNDSYWGEMYESDFVPEFALGRICYNDDTEIANQINKIMSYLMIPVETEVKSSFFVGEWLWDGPTWGGDYMDEMIGGSSAHNYTTVGVPTNWNITTLYDRTYGAADSWGPTQIRPLLSLGPNLVNHLGHSNTTYTMRLGNNQVTAQTITNNGSNHNFSLYFTQGCYSGSFDNRDTSPGVYVGDCIMEKMTSIATAAAGMIAHSRYGWGSQGSTDGASQYLHRQYIDAIFGENINEYGWTLVDSKIDNIPFINNDPVMYWVTYETNLFGDPGLMVWSDTPQQITAQLPGSWMVGVNSYQIPTNSPNAFLRIKQGNTIVFEGQADNSGLCNINMLSPMNPGQYTLYINARNRYPFVTTFEAIATQMPYVVCSTLTTNSANNLLESENVYTLNCVAKNVGLVNQTGQGTLTLTSASPNITVINGTTNFNALAAGDSLMLTNAFSIRVTGSYADHATANLQFTASYGTYTAQSTKTLVLNAPNLTLTGYQIASGGGVINPGDELAVNMTLNNNGSGNCYSPMLLLMEDSPYFSLSASDVFFSPVAPGQTTQNPVSFFIQIAGNAPTGQALSFNYVLLSENDPEETGVITFYVGAMNYTFEPDFQNWTTATLQTGFANQWHRSSNRNHTSGGGFAAKFGGTGSTNYNNSTYGALISPEMPLGLNSRLKFFHWIAAEQHSNPGYAWDGGNVQMSVNNGPWTLITPVGGYPYQIYTNQESPFAGGTRVYSGNSSWQEATFDLSQYSGTAKFRFVFGADANVNAEGWYIDDVRIESDAVAISDPITGVTNIALLGNYPNPFNPSTTISFSNSNATQAELSIYNVRGQRVKTLINGMIDSGTHNVVWNGLDEAGRSVSSGVYYYRLTTPSKTESARMILIK